MLNLFNRNMNSKVDTNIYLLVILLLGIMVCYFEPYMIPVVAIVFGLTYYFSRRTLMSKECPKQILKLLSKVMKICSA